MEVLKEFLEIENIKHIIVNDEKIKILDVERFNKLWF